MINIESSIYVKVVSPIHIGGAQEKNLMEGLDFLTIDGREYRIRESELYNPANGIDPDELSKILLTGNKFALQELIKKADRTKSKIVFPLNGQKGSTGDIKAFIKTGLNGKSYIPGSSLKGAMRSAVAHYLCNGSSGSNPDKEFIKDFDYSLFRFVKISDSKPFDIRLFRSKIASLGEMQDQMKIKWKERRNANTVQFSPEGFDTSFESPALHAICDFEIKIGQPFLKVFQNSLTELHPDSKGFLLHDDIINHFLLAINTTSAEYIKRELLWYKSYKGDQSIRIIEELERLQKLTRTEGYYLLHLGAGSGFHAMTGDWQFTYHNNLGKWTENDARKYGLTYKQRNEYINKKEKFKSRRIAFDQWPNPNYFGPMGFVLLSLIPFLPNEIRKAELNTNEESEEIPTKEVNEIQPIHRIVTIKAGTRNSLDGVVKDDKMVDVYMPDGTIRTVKLVSGLADPGTVIEVLINPDRKGNFPHASFVKPKTT